MYLNTYKQVKYLQSLDHDNNINYYCMIGFQNCYHKIHIKKIKYF